MPTVAVFDMAGKEIEKIELNEAVFGIEPNVAVMHDVVKNILANRRQGTQSALTRAEVSGGVVADGVVAVVAGVSTRTYSALM